MTLEELLAEGRQKLDELNRQRAANEAATAAENERLRREFWQDFTNGLAALLPAEVWPYVSYSTANDTMLWSHEVIIAAPDCAPILCEYLPRVHKFGGADAFRVPDVETGSYDNYGEGYAPAYVYSRRQSSCLTNDIALALAVARERHNQLAQATVAYEQLKAEIDQQLAARAVVAGPLSMSAATEPAPSVGDQLVALVRAIVREELANPEEC